MCSVSSALIFLLIFLTKGLQTTPAVPIREIDYSMEKGRVYSKQISHDGVNLRIGAHWQLKVNSTDEHTVLICVLHTNQKDYNIKFMPRVQLKVDETYRTLTPFKVLDYFVVTKKEIWGCRMRREDLESYIVTRIVTELISSVEVNQIQYHDGVQVTSKEFIGGTRSAVIREVKYYDTYNDAVMRYDGKVEIPETYHPKIANLDAKIRANDRTGAGAFKEIRSNGFQATRIGPYGGAVIEIGVPVTVYSLGSRNSIVQCEKYQGIQSDSPFEFRPKIKITPPRSSKTQPPSPQILTKDNYTEFITPIREEFWFCKGESNTGIQFWRVVNEIISIKFPLTILKYYDEVTELYTILPRAGFKTIRAKVITYHNYMDITKLTKFEGSIRLISPENGQEQKILKSSTDNINVENKEIEYVLEPGRVFRSFVSTQGLNIRVGTMWTRIIGKATDVVQCKLEPSEIEHSFDYETKFRLILKNYFKNYVKAIPRSQHTRYWEFVRQQVWTCEKIGSAPGYKFLRVVNELRGKKELYEVEYYDGVQLYSRVLDGTQRSVNILEIKYIDQVDFQVYKYEGKVMLKTTSESSKNYIDCLNCDGQPISKTENDIVFDDDDYRKSYPYEKKETGERITYNGQKMNVYNWRVIGIISLLFGKDPAELTTVGSIEDTVECGEINDRRDDFHTHIRINSIEEPTSYNDIPVKDRVAGLTGIAIELLQQRVWSCRRIKELNKQHESVYKLYRVYNELKIISKILKSVSTREGTEVRRTADDSMTIKETRYLTTDFTDAKYEGLAVFQPNLTDDKIMSGTMDLTGSQYLSTKSTEQQSNGPGIVYELDRERTHKVTVLNDGVLVVQLGKKWTKQHVGVFRNNYQKAEIVKCDINDDISLATYNAEYKPYCKTITDSFIENRGDSLQLFENYFLVKSWEIWDCKNDTGSVVFRRVVTDFELKTLDANRKSPPIKEIHFYDGLGVFRGTRVTGGYGWLFREIRYTAVDDSTQTIKYTGKLELNENHIDAQFINEFESSNIHTCLLNLAERSMSYQLDSNNKLFKTVFETPGGSALRVGSRYEKEIVDSRTFSCEEFFNKGHAFEAKVEIAAPDSYLFKYMKVAEQDLFRRLPSQYWQCTPTESGPSIKLIRVKNRLEMQTTDPLAQLMHFDGVTVSADGKIIEEIKFFDASDNKVVKFDGFIILDKFHDHDTTDKTRRKYREIDYVLDTELTHTRKFSEGKMVFQIGSKWDEIRGSSQQEAKCYMYHSGGSQISMLSRVMSVKGESNFVIKPLDYKNEVDYPFYQIRSAYKCFSPEFGEFVKMVVLNVVTNPSEISEICYPDGVTVWFDYDSHRKPYGWKLFIREVKFMDISNLPLLKVIKFEGKITNVYPTNTDKYDEGSSIEEIPPLTPVQYEKQKEKQLWFKNYKKWQTSRRGKEPIENIVFTPSGVESTVIQAVMGYNVDIGSKWEKEVGSFDDIYTCNIDTHKYDTSKLMTRIVLHMDEQKMRLDDVAFHEYFQLEKREVFKCTKGADSFLRVVTEITGRTGIKRVNYYNGVKIIRKSIRLDLDTVLIVEQKYLDPTDFKVIKYVGNLVKQ